MSKNNLTVAEAYYQALNNKDITGMAQCLHPQVRFLAPLAEMTGKDAVLEAAKRLFPFFNSLTLRAKFSAGNEAMCAYDLDCPLPIGIFHTASLLTFEDGLIARIELFYDARPFDKAQIFSAPSKE